jgi:hypothetical protein
MSEWDAAAPTVRAYLPNDVSAWDDLVSRSCNGTFLHTRRFISYHGDRFDDRSAVLENRRGRIVGLIPAAACPSDRELVVSHPGLTYGGVVHDGSVRGAAMIAAIERIAGHYRGLGYSRLRYKTVPAMYHSVPAEDDLYALFRFGARRYRSDLSAAVDLSSRGRVDQRRMRSRRRAEAAGVRTEEGWTEIGAFWQILEQNLARRHGAVPPHTLPEIQLLHDRFPDEIILIVAKIDDVPVAGTVLFWAGQVLHMQYSASTEDGRTACATDLVMEHAISLAGKQGCRCFDFGTNTMDEGRSLGQDLYQFKISFGAGGLVYDHYELDLC